MAWIESHQELAAHPKTKRLARLLDVHIAQAIGHLHLLWWWALAYAEDGDLSIFDPDEVADACQWEGDPELLIDALGACGRGGGEGFVTDDLQLHDWHSYAGKLVEKRKQDAERKRRSRATSPDVPKTSNGRPADVAGNSTVPNLNPSSLPAEDDGGNGFEDFWNHYPRRDGKRVGKNKALWQWERLKPPEREAAMVGVRNYASSGWRPKDAERWLRDRCWDDWQEPVKSDIEFEPHYLRGVE